MINRMNERGISSREIKETIIKGEKSHRKDCCNIAKLKLLEVVYKEQTCHYFGITTYYSEGE